MTEPSPLLNKIQNNIDNFKRSGSSDTIHCEYRSHLDSLIDVLTFQRSPNNEKTGKNWKSYWPTFAMSICKSMTCSFFTTVFGGVLVGVVATVVMWLDINTLFYKL